MIHVRQIICFIILERISSLLFLPWRSSCVLPPCNMFLCKHPLMFLFHIQAPRSFFEWWIYWGQWFVVPGLCHVPDDLWFSSVHRTQWLWNSNSSTIVRQFVNYLYLYVFTCGRVFSLVKAPCTFDMYDECMKRESKRYLNKIGNQKQSLYLSYNLRF